MQAGKPVFAAQCHLSRGVSEAFLQKIGILSRLLSSPISAVLRAGRGHICLGQDIQLYAGGIIRQPGKRSHGRCRTGLHMQNAGFWHRRPVPPEKNKNKNKSWIQYQLCILTLACICAYSGWKSCSCPNPWFSHDTTKCAK